MMTMFEVCKQSWLCHPDWTPQDHYDYLEMEECRNPARLGENIGKTPLETIQWWINSKFAI